MFGYASFFWPLIVGMSLYASLLHLQIGLRRPVDRAHTLFGLLALCVSVAVVANIELATSRTPSEYQAAIWLSSSVATFVFVLFPWFVTHYADEPKRRYAAALSAVYIAILVINAFQPYSMLQSGPPVLQQAELPWGEHITRSITPPTAWSHLLWIAHGMTILYVVFACVGLFRRGPRFRAWGLLLSAGSFAMSLAINILVRFGIVNFPYVAAPGFLAMVLLMSVALTRESRRTHQQMQTVLDNVPAVVYLKRADGRYVFVNRHFEHLYNLAANHVIGKTDSQLFDAQRAARYGEYEQQALAANHNIEHEEVLPANSGGKQRTYAMTHFALRDADGERYGLCGIATDVTERTVAADALRDLAVSLERRVARRTNELAQLNRELEAFAYSVSHDLRAPLTAVNGFAELLLREHGPKLDQTAMRYLNRIRDGSLRMAALIQDLLGLSRVTQQKLERKQIDLATLAEDALRPLRESDPIRDVSIVIEKPLPANGDAPLVNVALTNLLSNAWKYTSKIPNARIEVGSMNQQGETVYFVKDNGAGFNPEYVDRLFRPFVRLHPESEFPGTGIGLATVARIVARHGGRIWAQGQLGGGATFFFTLPTSDEEPAAHSESQVASLET